MKRSLLLDLAVVLALAAAGCGEARPAQPSPTGTASTTAYVLAQRAGVMGLQPVDLATGSLGPALPAGVMSPDGRRLYSVSGTALRAIDPGTGAVVSTSALPPGVGFPSISGEVPAGLSQDGTHLVLESGGWRAGAARLWVGDLRSGAAQTVDLDGLFEFDGVANDGRAAYLLQWLPAQPGRYSVRQYDLERRVLQPFTLTDKTEGQSSMRGSRLASADDPRGVWQYTLYLGGPTGVFVHALQLMGDFPVAWCLELPRTDPVVAAAWSIAVGPDGSRVYAVNSALSQLVVIHASRNGDRPAVDAPQALRSPGSARLPFVVEASAKELAGGRGVVSPDGTRLYAPGLGAVLVIDTRTGRLVQSVDIGEQSAVSLALTRDSRTLLALTGGGRLVEVDTRTLTRKTLALGLERALTIAAVR